MKIRALAAAIVGLALVASGVEMAPSHAAAGNNGTVKVSGIDDLLNPGSDPKVGCTFSIEWAKFEDGSTSTIAFVAQSPTQGAGISVVGPKTVAVGDATVRQDYTLTFTGTPAAAQGYHVTLTANTTGTTGNSDTKSKTFWVLPCDSTGSTVATAPTHCGALDSGVMNPAAPADALFVGAPSPQVITGYCVVAGGKQFSTTLSQPIEQTWIQSATGGAITEYSLSYGLPVPIELPTTLPTPGPSDDGSFDWNWSYPAPTCSALSVTYPDDIPANQSNDVNIKISYAKPDGSGTAEITLNYHNNLTTWSGKKSFTYAEHANWPANVKSYSVVWTQVGGTNFHWGDGQRAGEQPIVCSTDGDPATDDIPQTVTTMSPAAPITTTVGKASAQAVSLRGGGTGVRDLQLQQLIDDNWITVATVSSSEVGDGSVTVPTTTVGTATYRVVAPATVRNHSTVSEAFTVVTEAAPVATIVKPGVTVIKHKKHKKKHKKRKHKKRKHKKSAALR